MHLFNPTAVMGLLVIYTLLCGIWDLKTRHIHAGMSFLFAGAGLLLSLMMKRDPAEIGQALLPGLIFLVLSKASGGGVGLGDAVYLLVCAAYTDVERLLWMIVFSLLLSAAGALCIIVRGNFQCNQIKKRTLPYLTFMIPALFGSFLIYRAV